MSADARRRIAIAFVLLCLAAGALSAWRLATGRAALQTSIVALLPGGSQARWVDDLTDHVLASAQRQVALVVSAPSGDTARRAAAFLADRLRRTRAFSHVRDTIPAAIRNDFFDALFPNRWRIPFPLLEEARRTGSSLPIVEDALARLYAPLSAVPGDLIARDPGFAFAHIAAALPSVTGAFSWDDGYLTAKEDGRTHVLITARCAQDAFAANQQRRIRRAVTAAIAATAQRFPDGQIRWTGMVRYAAAAQRQAQSEIGVIGTVSAIGVVLLFLWAFRSVRELGFVLLSIAAGLGAALWCTVSLFGGVHLVTLVFGASLIGICVDFGFHFFAHRHTGASTDRLFVPITLGMATSVLGYAALYAAPLVGMRQMAVFASCGLVASWATVVGLFPAVGAAGKGFIAPWLLTAPAAYARAVAAHPRRTAAVVAVVAVAAALGMTRLRTADDIRLLRGDFPQIDQDARAIDALLRLPDQSRFIALQDRDPQRLLTRVASLSHRLAGLQRGGALEGHTALTHIVPPLRIQERTRRTWKRIFSDPRAAPLLDAVGLAPAQARALVDAADTPWTVERAASHPSLADIVTPLWLAPGAPGAPYRTAVLLRGVADPAAVRAAASRDGGVYVDKVREVSEVFRHTRSTATALVLAAYALIALIAVGRYGWRKGTKVIAVPAVVSALVLGVQGWTGAPLNAFGLFALILVSAIGIDYALFFAESRGEQSATAAAVTLAACTTVLSFGLLAAGDTPAVATLGTTILGGIVGSALLAPWCGDKE